MENGICYLNKTFGNIFNLFQVIDFLISIIIPILWKYYIDIRFF